jgi:hypothetical protein
MGKMRRMRTFVGWVRASSPDPEKTFTRRSGDREPDVFRPYLYRSRPLRDSDPGCRQCGDGGIWALIRRPKSEERQRPPGFSERG